MSTYTETLSSFEQQWRTGSVSACFSWPSNSVVENKLLLTLGDDVLFEEKNPHWRYQVAHGINASTDFRADERELSYVPGYLFAGKWCNTSKNWGYFQVDGDTWEGAPSVWDMPAFPSTSESSETRALAVTRAIQAARRKQSHFRGGNFLAELRDTLRGIRNPAKGIRDLTDTYFRSARRAVRKAAGRATLPRSAREWNAFQRANLKRSQAVQRALADSWLELQFGWLPLASDAADAYKALRRLSLRIPIERFSGRADVDSSTSVSTFTKTWQGVLQCKTEVHTWSRAESWVYGGVKISTSCPSTDAFEEFGVQARDFVPAVWEAIPYSFLIDYFTNIGDIFEVATFPWSDLAWVSGTFRNWNYRKCFPVGQIRNIGTVYPASGSFTVWGYQPAQVYLARKYVSRVKVQSLHVPTIQFEIPGFRNWRKYFNISALARLRTL